MPRTEAPPVPKPVAPAPEALTVTPIGERVYRYSVSPRSAWTAEDLGRILHAIVAAASPEAPTRAEAPSEVPPQ